ncbi:Nif3-like dinuclear metal center hexameric protein [Isoptericola variabilis]|uniref:GTP cyclohydrolase 1 type 2 homolog n=1 Tax=Isoptericola variabilis (strain 225) TaxID=743718 RepID=F6FQA0_ISOV2|nr:Nif3-like dinuclear metal center hexameric protein [Isoptericola variabilis]AEG42853.1 NGG1p interacting factor 3 protein, NIF3 [Isoptericola variabilis 225]TWH30993.1 putative NIF3 family GTP cyclohydrolase 1 type 2 [Isoptericola variabilis J7]
MSPLTAGELVDLAAAELGVPARPTTVDGVVAGDPSAVVRGVAVTTLATLEVLERAVAAGANVVVTHEPLFYDHLGAADAELEAERDPVHAAKRAFLADHGIVVWRQHDAWHDRRPDGVDEGAARALGWTLDPAEAARGTAVADVGPTTLGELAAHAARALDARALRFVGDPALPVRRAALDLGFRGFARNRRLLRRDDVDAVLVGEAHEWETGSYATDAARVLGTGLVVVGHVPSEQAGMRFFADRLRDVVARRAPDVDVAFLATPDAYATP